MVDVRTFRHLRPDEWHRLSGTNLGAQMIKNGIRYNIKRANDPIINDDSLDEIDDWCDENITGLYYLFILVGDNTAYFELETDATAFILRFDTK